MLKSATRLVGVEVPRLWTKPLRELTPETSAGFDCITFAEEVVKISLMPWQKWSLIHMLELKEDGSFRFRYILLLVARQNGKTTLIQILALWRLFVDRAPLVIGTAQNLDVAEEAWQGAVDMVLDTPDLFAELEHIDKQSGKKAIRLKTRERYKVQAANRRGGRGLSGDMVVLDELREHQNWLAWGAVTKTTMARDDAQVICMSNAGDAESVVLNHLHEIGLKYLESPEMIDDEIVEGTDTLCLIEYSAVEGCAINDTEQWREANPGLGWIINRAAIASAMQTDDEAVFRTEVLCQFVDTLAAKLFEDGVWGACADLESQIEGRVVLSVETDVKREWTCIAAGGFNAEHKVHIEIVDMRKGTGWAFERLKELKDKWGSMPLMIDGHGPAASLIPGLISEGFDVHQASTEDVTRGSAYVYDGVVEGTITHIDQPDLNVAVAGAQKRPIGDAYAWGRRLSHANITPFVSGTLAAWGVTVYGNVNPLNTIW